MTYPYEKDCFTDPYHIQKKRDNANQTDDIALTFDNFDAIITACSDRQGNCPVTVVVPGNGVRTGYPTDTLNLHKVITTLTTICGQLVPKKNLVLEDFPSWECDDYNMAQVSDDSALSPVHVSDLENLKNIIPQFANDRPENDLEKAIRDHATAYKEERREWWQMEWQRMMKYIPELAAQRMEDDQKWEQRCLRLMKERQIDLCETARRVLQENNLIVLGSPGVNQVAENFWEILLLNRTTLAQLKMYVVPGADTFPEQIFALTQTSDEQDEQLEALKNNDWTHINCGWLQMIRNPWSLNAEAPRFLILVGGFQDHGTQTALLKLNEYLEQSVGRAPTTTVQVKKTFEPLPAVIVKSTLELPPQKIFVATERRDRVWTRSPTTFRGSHRDARALGSSAYTAPYRCDSYKNPYNIDNQNPTFALEFGHFEDIIRRCSNGSNCPATIVFPGNGIRTGYPTDTLNLHKVISNLTKICDTAGAPLDLNNYLSWECNDFTMKQSSIAAAPPMFMDDLKSLHWICASATDMTPEERWEAMRAREEQTTEEAKAILSQNNLIVIGSPGVNQVARNFWEILLFNNEAHNDIKLFVAPGSSSFPEQLFWSQNGQRVDTWVHNKWADNNIGWLQMIRNPWAAQSTPRFLILIGGFRDHGTQAALLKLNQIFADKCKLLNKPGTAEQVEQFRRRADFCDRADSQRRYPVHVVKSKLNVPPLSIFLTAQRRDRGWTSTPTTFRGSIGDKDFEIVERW